jgi:hypothetical protein
MHQDRQRFAHGTEIRRNPHNSSNWDSSISTQLDYKHFLYQNLVSTKQTSYYTFMYKKGAYLLEC